MTKSKRKRVRPASKSPRQTPKIFPILTASIAVCLVALLVLSLVLTHRAKELPIDFRIPDPALSRLPVQISDVRSCSCWSGPRDQAERKYKFRVLNQSSRLLNIGGGASSAIRLLVAYPHGFTPHLTFPQRSASDEYAPLGSPKNQLTEIASGTERVTPSRIWGANKLFDIPRTYSLWALPPTPDELAEMVPKDGGYTYPTEISKEWLIPGEGYFDSKRGHGVWTFYIPLKPSFAKVFDGGLEIVIEQARYEKEVIFVGIAAFAQSPGVQLIGFAPAPSDAALAAPSDL